MPEMLKTQLDLYKLPDRFADIYEEIKNSWQLRARQILSDEYIENVLVQSNVLTDQLDLILQAAQQLRQSDALSLLVCLLERWVQEESFDARQYSQPTGAGLAYDFLHLFPVIPAISVCIDSLRKRGLPEDIIADTMAEYDYCVKLSQDSMGRPAFDFGRLEWIRRVVKNRLIHIGRFKYDLPGRYMKGFCVYQNKNGEIVVLADGVQVHQSGGILGSAGLEDTKGSFLAQITETQTVIVGNPVVNGLIKGEKVCLDKTAWTLRLSPEDPVLGIHIPPGGGFDTKTVRDAFDRARMIFRQYYPDYPFEAFFCSSWLLSPQLREILKPESNILAFQNMFAPIPCHSEGAGCFSFLFGILSGAPDDLRKLPETTSLQQAVKQLYLRGGFLHEGEGFFF